MLSKTSIDEEAHRLAYNGLGHVVSSGLTQFVAARRRIQERNSPQITVQKTIITYLLTKHSALIQQIEPLLSQNISSTALLVSLIGAFCFAVVGLVLSRKTLEPFNMRLSGEVFALGLSLLFPYAKASLRKLYERKNIAGPVVL